MAPEPAAPNCGIGDWSRDDPRRRGPRELAEAEGSHAKTRAETASADASAIDASPGTGAPTALGFMNANPSRLAGELVAHPLWTSRD
jgi:hypothetical protein